MLSFERKGRGVRAILAIAAMALVLGACGAAAGPVGDTVGRPVTPGGLPAVPDGQGGGNDEQDGGSGDRGPLYQDVGRPDLLIIKTGSIAIQVTGIDEAVGAATRTIVDLGGYASASERTGEDDDARASVTYRVPAERWDEALAAIRALGAKVLGERSGTDDVTAQVVDLAARIRNLQVTEQAFQEIMSRAIEIEDVLDVQAELTKVRGEIEQLTAQKNRLEEQAALSTLTVAFSLKPDPVLASAEQFDPAVEANEATASLVSILQALATAGIWFAIVWLPILAVLGVVALVAFVVVRRVRRAGETAAVTPSA